MTRGKYKKYFRLGGLLLFFGLFAPWAGAIAPVGGAALALVGLAGLLAHEHAYVQAGQSVPLA